MLQCLALPLMELILALGLAGLDFIDVENQKTITLRPKIVVNDPSKYLALFFLQICLHSPPWQTSVSTWIAPSQIMTSNFGPNVVNSNQCWLLLWLVGTAEVELSYCRIYRPIHLFFSSRVPEYRPAENGNLNRTKAYGYYHLDTCILSVVRIFAPDKGEQHYAYMSKEPCLSSRR